MLVLPIYDSFLTEYKNPFGAVAVGTEITFRLAFPRYAKISEPTLGVFRPGNKEHFEKLEFERTENDAYNIYSGKYSPLHEGVHYYYFGVIEGGTKKEIKRTDANHGDYSGKEMFQLTVYEKNFSTPDWLKGGVMYQIFPDRFAKYQPKDDEDYNSPEPLSDRKIHLYWDESPKWQADSDGIYRNNDYFGGNLKGIMQKLPYLSELGVTCVYLNPIFEAHENHRYCTANYEHVDPLLGTEKDFKELCKKGEEYGIKFILDGVFSHTGADSVYFNKYGRYGQNSGAFRDSESPYREWYCFKKYPNEYESWWGFDSLPNVNENNPAYTEYITGQKYSAPTFEEFTAAMNSATLTNLGNDEAIGLLTNRTEKSEKPYILKKWIDLGAAGWRLDVADELPDEFIDNIRKGIKTANENAVLYGEVWEDATTKESYGVRRRYLIGKQLDSVMNYPFSELILNYARYGSYREFVDGIMTVCENYPKESVDILMNFLGTHDTERSLTRLSGERAENHDRKWQSEHFLSDAQYAYGTHLLRIALALIFFLPGVPCIYYGDEAGLEGYKDPFNRGTYPWGKEDFVLIEYVKELSKVRGLCPAFAKGEIKFYKADEKELVFLRHDTESGDGVMVYINRSKETVMHTFRKFSETVVHYEVVSGINAVSSVSPELPALRIPPFGYGAVKIKFER